MKYNELKPDSVLTLKDYETANELVAIRDGKDIIAFMADVLPRIRQELMLSGMCGDGTPRQLEVLAMRHPISILCVSYLVYLSGGMVNFGIKQGEAAQFCTIRAAAQKARTIRVLSYDCGGAPATVEENKVPPFRPTEDYPTPGCLLAELKHALANMEADPNSESPWMTREECLAALHSQIASVEAQIAQIAKEAGGG
jgi:hypothetical protein